MNLTLIKRYLVSGSERTSKAKKNVLLMLLYKGLTILIGLLLVPITIGYVDSENYGIWLTLSSMVTWISFFDIGLNNGLKNKLTECLATGDYALGKKYVSTTYAILALIFIPLMLLLLMVVPFINWESLLNISPQYGQSLLAAVCILVVYFCLNFILSTINIIMMANQEPADASLRNLIQQAVSLAIIYLLTLTTQGSLIKLCLALCASPLLVVLFFNITLFRGKYSKLAPSIRDIDFHKAPSLMKLGVQFFIIQVAGVIQWQMANFLIIRYFGATSVTEYNIAYKYFGILAMLWAIFNSPLWAAVTDAMAKEDYQWIKNAIRKFIRLFLLLSLCGVLMLVVSPYVYDIWIGDKVDMTFELSAALLIYNIAIMFSGIFVAVINGTGRLKVQVYACLVSPIVYLVCFFLFTKTFEWGIYSVIAAAIIANFNGLILAPLQCRSILRGKTSKQKA